MTKYIKLILRFQDANGDTIIKAIRESAPLVGIGLLFVRRYEVAAYVPAKMSGPDAVAYLYKTFDGLDFKILTEEQAAQEPLSTWTMPEPNL